MTRNVVDLPSRQPHPQTATSRQRIDANLLIPGRGDPITKGTLIYDTDSGRILFVGATSDLPSTYSHLRPSHHVPVLMPGLWDCHVHYFGSAEHVSKLALLPPPLAGMRIARDVVATLNAGYTSVREMGGYGTEIKAAVDEGWIPGPHIYAAGAPLSQTGGHGDLQGFPLTFLQESIKYGWLPLCIVDGVEAVTAGVRTQIRKGAKVIKVLATGGVSSLHDSPRASQFTKAEMEAIVQEATRTDLVVAAHAHGSAGILAALKAGVKTIEHGSYLTDEVIDLMIEKDAMLVATRAIIDFYLQHTEMLPPESQPKVREVANVHMESYKAAVKAGVKCALGTDLGISKEGVKFNHGMNGRELRYAVEAGMTPLQAIEAATANGPETLGPQAPLSGQLKEGYDADFIAVGENPLENVEILAKVEMITHVWKAGKMVKSPGKMVSLF